MNKSDNAFTLRWAKKIRAINLMGGHCQKCGNRNMFCLEFHHINGLSKNSDIGTLLVSRWSVLREELASCQLLCKNCHQAIHSFGTDRNIRLKERLMSLKGVEKCERCGYGGNVGCLVFHHHDDKQFPVNVSGVRGREITWESILLEIDKCDLLCCNCHEIEHTDIVRFERLKEEILAKVDSHKELRCKIDRELVYDMLRRGMKQKDIVNELRCSKGAISGIYKEFRINVVE